MGGPQHLNDDVDWEAEEEPADGVPLANSLARPDDLVVCSGAASDQPGLLAVGVCEEGRERRALLGDSLCDLRAVDGVESVGNVSRNEDVVRALGERSPKGDGNGLRAALDAVGICSLACLVVDYLVWSTAALCSLSTQRGG